MQNIDYQEMVNSRRLFGGEPTKLMAISPMKHTWARDFWDQMRANNWNKEEINFERDKKCFRDDLTDSERRMFEKCLAFLSNLDGIQLHNLTDNISVHVTSPEVRMVLTRQAYEEALHVDAYSIMAESFAVNPMEIYTLFMRDEVLKEKNDKILAQSEILKQDGSARSFGLAIISNIILEGVYFYSNFLAFYTLARRGKMLSSADNIRLIQRDEVCHLNFFIRMHQTMVQENPHVYDEQFWVDARELFRVSTELEIAWGKYIIADGVLGLTDSIMEGHIKHLANSRAERIGMSEIFPGVKDPCSWVEDFSRINGDESNFFESRVKAYQEGTLAW